MTKDELIQNYMNERLLNGVYLEEEHVGKLWRINGRCIFIYMYTPNILYIRQSVWDELCNMFSLGFDKTNDLFKGWSIRNLCLPNSTIIRTTYNFS